MASFDALLEAAQFLEHRNTPGSKTRATADNKNFHAYSKSASQQENKTNGKGESSSRSSRGDDDDTNVKRPGGHGTREVHNKLEKNRRAHLKECFENLRLQIPNMEDKKTSNLAILRSALRHINAQRRREKELEMFMQHLAREKIVMQDRIKVLKQELQELHVDVDLASFLKSIQESDNHSQSTATADGDDPILSDVEEDGIGETAMVVTVEAQPYSPTQASTVSTNNHIHTVPVIKTTSPQFKKVTLAAAPSSASSILATAAEAAQIKVVGTGGSKPNALSITNSTGGMPLLTLTPTSTGNKPLTLFNTVTAGQNASSSASGTCVPGIMVAPPTTRPPVTQILQQQLTQRALFNQARLQQQQQQQQQQPSLILQPTAAASATVPASAIPHMITLSPQQLRGLTAQAQQQQRAVTITTASTASPTVAQPAQQTFTLAQLPYMGLSQPAAPPRTPTPATAIPIQQLLSQLNAAAAGGGTVLSLQQAPAAGTTQNTAQQILNIQPAAQTATTSTSSVTAPTIFSIQPAGAAVGTQQTSAIVTNANTILSPTFSLQPASLLTATTAAASATTASPLKLNTSTGFSFPTVVSRSSNNNNNTVQLPSAQFITPQQLQQLVQQAVQQQQQQQSPVQTSVSAQPPQVVLQPAAPTHTQAQTVTLTPSAANTSTTNTVIYQLPQVAAGPSTSSATTLSQAQLQAALLKQLGANTGQITSLSLPTISPLMMVSMPSLVTTPTSSGQTTTIQLVAAPNASSTTTTTQS